MSVNNAEPTGEVKNYPDEPLPSDNGVNYDSYASDDNVKKATNTGLDFDSKEFERRQKHEYFVNVAGAEKLKREEERREAIAEKQRLKELKKISAVSHDEKKTVTRTDSGDDAQKKIQRKIANEKRRTRFVSIFGNKKLLLTVGVAIVVIVAGALIFAHIVSPALEQVSEEKTRKENQNSENNAAAINGRANQLATEQGNTAAEKYFEDSYSSATSDSEKVYISIYYARFVLVHRDDSERAVEILNRVSDVSKSYEMSDDYYLAYKYIYETTGDIDKAKENAEKFGREYYSD